MYVSTTSESMEQASLEVAQGEREIELAKERACKAIEDAKRQLAANKLIAEIEQEHQERVVGSISETYDLDATDTEFIRETLKVVKEYHDSGQSIHGIGNELAIEAKRNNDIDTSSDGKVLDMRYYFALRNIEAKEDLNSDISTEATVTDIATRLTSQTQE